MASKVKGPKPLTIVIKLGWSHFQISELILLKIGTSSIVDEKTHEPLLSVLTLIVETAVKLHKDGHKVIIVSSGAIGVGLRRMDYDKRPKHLPTIQARDSPWIEDGLTDLVYRHWLLLDSVGL